MRYNVFIRRWWKDNPNWYNGLEPHLGRKTFLRKGVSLETAKEIARNYNNTHDPGRYSVKAEFERS